MSVDLNDWQELDAIQWRLKRDTFHACTCKVKPNDHAGHDMGCPCSAALAANKLIDAYRHRDNQIKDLWALLGLATVL